MTTIRTDLLDILCCPTCKADLKLEVRRKEGEEIMEGSLVCTQCHHPYPIDDGIPNLLPPDAAEE